MRILAFACLGVTAFCVFGFAATHEPLDRSSQLAWRTAYGVGIVVSLAGMAWALSKARRADAADADSRRG